MKTKGTRVEECLLLQTFLPAPFLKHMCLYSLDSGFHKYFQLLMHLKKTAQVRKRSKLHNQAPALKIHRTSSRIENLPLNLRAKPVSHQNGENKNRTITTDRNRSPESSNWTRFQSQFKTSGDRTALRWYGNCMRLRCYTKKFNCKLDTTRHKT